MPKFDIGQRVKRSRHCPSRFKVGSLGTIREIDSFGHIQVEWDDDPNSYYFYAQDVAAYYFSPLYPKGIHP